jgi:carboxymethylenebutenolidase
MQAMAAHDLAALWDAHCRYEFEARDVDATMATMVAEPYVNHIPTMTGGVGFDKLRDFYANHFVGVNPPDFELVPVSRTVGESSVLPGIEPTGRAVEIPLVAIVQFDGDKLVHEHIYWDQASVLVQLGLLEAGASGGLPIAGAETAHKVLNPSLPSNTLMESAR